jgi:hypothetical protein
LEAENHAGKATQKAKKKEKKQKNRPLNLTFTNCDKLLSYTGVEI